MLASLIKANRTASEQIRRQLEIYLGRRDGRQDFLQRRLPGLLRQNLRILDVGSGRRPTIDLETKKSLGLYVVGLDISREELQAAPPEAYDEVIVGSVETVAIPQQFDLIVSVTVLEHIANNKQAIENLAQALRSGARMAHFLPCRNAGFSLINRVLGHRLGRWVLFRLLPDVRESSGFKAYYDRCTPSEMVRLCAGCGLEDVQVTTHFASEYFAFFTPAYCLEACRQLLLRTVKADNFAEMFTLVARKPQSLSPVVENTMCGPT